jgi:hypothetical protein
MSSIPVFIEYPPEVQADPSTSPILVDAGSSFSVTFSTEGYSSDYVMNVITVNGSSVAANSRRYTATVNNIQNPVFIVVRNVIPVSLVTGTSTHDPCCGIKHMQLSLQEDGSITGSMTGLKGDVYDMIGVMMSGALTSRTGSNAYRINTYREDGATITITASSIVNDTYEKLPTSAVFKTIPQEIYDLHISGVIARSMQNPLEAPDSQIYIRSSDVYGTDGWTVQDILDTLGIKAVVPSAYNYHVYQLSVSRGAPVISLMHNLLPIPGLVIERVSSVISGNTIAAYYISTARGTGNFYGTTCVLSGNSSRTVQYETTVVGLPGEPQYIDALVSTTIGDADNSMTLNLIGGIFSVDVSTTENTVETAAKTSVNITGS